MTEQTQTSINWIITFVGILFSIGYMVVILKNQRLTASKNILMFWGLCVSLWFFLIPLTIGDYFAEVPEYLIDPLPVYGNLVLTCSFFVLTRNFLKLHQTRINPVILSLVFITALIYIISFSFLRNQSETYFLLNGYLSVAFWISVIIITGHDLYQSFLRSQRPLHRNRIGYWTQIFFLEILIGIALFTGFIALGGLFRILQLCIITYVVMTHPLPDFHHTIRKILKYGLVSVSVLFIFFSGLMTHSYLVSTFSQWNPVIITAGLLTLMALLMKPVFFGLTNIIDQIIPDHFADLQSSLREYNQVTSKILDLQDLGHQLLLHIDNTIEIERGYLFNVEKETTEISQKYILKGFAAVGDSPQREISIDPSDPIFQTIFINHHPVTQYEIDFLPIFADTSIHLKRRLDELEVEIFVPIIARDECIGIIALGTKSSGDSYSTDEILFLQALSDQSVIALENARLFNGLTRLNNEYRRAYSALEQSNLNLEKAVRQLEKLDRVKTDFLTILSHELRTPMTLISGYAQLLLDELDIQKDPVLYPLIKGIDDGTRRLEDIIQSILDMSAIDARAVEVKIQSVIIDDIINQLQGSLSNILQDREMFLSIEKLSNLPPIETDPNLLVKALYQILSNAIKYSPNSSTITLNIRLQTSDLSPLGEPSIEFEIIDQGIGIDQEQIDLIFNKFYQTQDVLLHSSGKAKFKGGGPGLGLAIAKGIITDLHGRVWAESHGHDEEKSTGSSFFIVLPLQRDPTGKPPNIELVTNPINSSRV